MSEQTHVDLDERTLMLFEGSMKRIFALKISRSTFRELQNVILTCANQDKKVANFLLETLMNGQIKPKIPEKQRPILEDVIKNFTIPTRLAKEIYERGDFVSIVTSDLVAQQEDYAFLSRIRRIDGEEFIFLSDPQNLLHLLQHFVGRLHELKQAEKGKEKLAKYKSEMIVLRERIKQLID